MSGMHIKANKTNLDIPRPMLKLTSLDKLIWASKFDRNRQSQKTQHQTLHNTNLKSTKHKLHILLEFWLWSSFSDSHTLF